MFDTRLKVAREAKGLSQAELARGVGVTRDLVNKYEKAGVKPSFGTLVAIAEYLNVSTDYLLGVDEPTPDEKKDSPNDGGAAADPDIRRIQRAKKKMPEKEWERHMKIVEAAFGDYYADDYAVTDLDE